MLVIAPLTNTENLENKYMGLILKTIARLDQCKIEYNLSYRDILAWCNEIEKVENESIFKNVFEVFMNSL